MKIRASHAISLGLALALASNFAITGSKAATTTAEIQTFQLTVSMERGDPPLTVSEDVFFQQFDASLGTLTAVQFDFISTGIVGATSIANSLEINGEALLAGTSSNLSYNLSALDGTISGAVPLSFFEGTGSFAVSAILSATCDLPDTKPCAGTWDAESPLKDGTPGGLTLTYQYDEVSAVPLPAALPLLLSAFGGLGLLRWRARI